MDHLNFWLTPQSRNQIKGHQVPADGEILLPLFVGQAQDRDASVIASHRIAGSLERIGRRMAAVARAVNNWRYSLRRKARKQTLQCCLSAAPFGGIVFTQEMNDSHLTVLSHA